jgi:predicted SAM-dependent methyltransferase
MSKIIATKRIINNSKFLISLVRPFRQRLSCLKIDKSDKNLLAIGEHRIFPGWISTNYNVFAPIFFDGTSKILPKRHFKAILLDNVIEHIPRERAESFLKNCHTLLEQGGILRIATPDFAGFVEKYIEKDSVFLEMYRNELLSHKNIKINKFIDPLRSILLNWGHLTGYVYDYQTLTDLLVLSGFKHENISRCLPGDSNFVFLSKLEGRSSSIEPQIVIELVK